MDRDVTVQEQQKINEAAGIWGVLQHSAVACRACSAEAGRFPFEAARLEANRRNSTGVICASCGTKARWDYCVNE